jgi:hypothetical protein
MEKFETNSGDTDLSSWDFVYYVMKYNK